MKPLTIEKVLFLHQKMVSATGGADGLRDIGLLDSAISSAHSTFDGNDLFPNVIDKAAATCYSVIQNHPFIDGNKRMGIYLMLIILEINGLKLKFTQDELVDLGLGIAKGNFDRDSIIDWINRHVGK